MNNFKKAALASSLLAAFAVSNDASATVIGAANTSVILGCTVPAGTTAAATVYSIDAYDSNAAVLTGLPSWLKSGASCSRAVNWLTINQGQLSSVNNQVGNSGYSLQAFTFNATAANYTGVVSGANSVVSMIGCALPAGGTAGASVYSVDGLNSAGSTANTGITLTALGGNPCSSALAVTNALGTNTGIVNTQLNVRTADGTYSLEQYIVQ